MEIISQNAIPTNSNYKMEVAVKSSRSIGQYLDKNNNQQLPTFNRIFMDPKEGFSLKPKVEYNDAIKRASIIN